jgi:hypothetical protein
MLKPTLVDPQCHPWRPTTSAPLHVSRMIGVCLTAVLAVGLVGCATHAPSDKLAAADNPDCLKGTATRIQDPNRKCVNAPGSSYTQKDLQRTGEIDTGAALKKLDPRFQ